MANNFDGVDDNVSVSDSSSIQNIFTGGGTIIAFIRPETAGDSTAPRIDQKSGNLLFLTAESGTTWKLGYFTTFSTASGQWTTNSLAVDENVWNHTAITYDDDSTANNPTFYVDGTAEANTEDATPTGSHTSDASNDLFIGNRSGLDRSYDGDIGEYARFTTELSAVHIAAIARGANPFGFWNHGLVNYLMLGINTTTEPDFTANGNTGAVTGAIKSSSHPPVEPLENYL